MVVLIYARGNKQVVFAIRAYVVSKKASQYQRLIFQFQNQELGSELDIPVSKSKKLGSELDIPVSKSRIGVRA